MRLDQDKTREKPIGYAQARSGQMGHSHSHSPANGNGDGDGSFGPLSPYIPSEPLLGQPALMR